MKYERQKQVREALRAAPDGMTVKDLMEVVPTDRSHIQKILKVMPDAYIDRWIKWPMAYEAVWCVVTPPENCPKPTKEKKPKLSRGRPRKNNAAPENCYPSEGGCGDWEVLDRRGRPAPWLERKLTDRERSRIDDEVFEHMECDDDY
jgi:hypothetical protein